jgi:hypothetical protein
VAIIERHPKLEDYFVELTLPEISARGGVRDIFEDGRLILVKDYRLEFDFGALACLNKSIATVDDRALRKRLKKLTAPQFFEGKPPIRRKGLQPGGHGAEARSRRIAATFRDLLPWIRAVSAGPQRKAHPNFVRKPALG